VTAAELSGDLADGLTPSQTVGPYLGIGLPWPDGPDVVPPGTPGLFEIVGTVSDGHGDPVPDAMIETWQADPDGRFDHPDDPRGAPAKEDPGFGFHDLPDGADFGGRQSDGEFVGHRVDLLE